jgi:hypothetical protein
MVRISSLFEKISGYGFPAVGMFDGADDPDKAVDFYNGLGYHGFNPFGFPVFCFSRP